MADLVTPPADAEEPIRHGGPILVLNHEGVRLGSFPDEVNAERWMGWQNAHSELRIPMRWVDITDPIWVRLGLRTRPWDRLPERTVTT